MRTPMIAGNWKMNTTINEAKNLVKEMVGSLDRITGVVKVVCPPFVSLAVVKDLIKDSSVKLGAQNVYYVKKGAYTGEISPIMLAGLCEYVIIGHSERRQYFNETNEIINKKIAAALEAGLKPILCIGEKLDENEAGKTTEIVTSQLKQSLSAIKAPAGLVIAYEPVWAIGSGKAASGEQANQTIGLIRMTLATIFDKNFAHNTLILYGGSVTADNAAEFMRQSEIDGALVGGASLNAAQFVSIVRQTSEIKR